MALDSVLAMLTKDLVAGSLEVRLARNEGEIDAAQALRYRVFYEEMGAIPSEETLRTRRDRDALDAFCDHLLVLDNTKERAERVVGTYRLIRREHAAKNGSFYSAAEFDISPLIAYPGEILELGRSCIAPAYRNGTVMGLLWKGLALYMFQHDVKLMFGCASFHGADPAEHTVPLSYLYHYHLAPPALRASALPHVHVKMDLLPREAFDPESALETMTFNGIPLNQKAGSASLPPLIKGYLRVGCTVGDGAFLDKQFNTTDVCIIFKTELITDRYLRHYERAEKETI